MLAHSVAAREHCRHVPNDQLIDDALNCKKCEVKTKANQLFTSEHSHNDEHVDDVTTGTRRRQRVELQSSARRLQSGEIVHANAHARVE